MWYTIMNKYKHSLNVPNTNQTPSPHWTVKARIAVQQNAQSRHIQVFSNQFPGNQRSNHLSPLQQHNVVGSSQFCWSPVEGSDVLFLSTGCGVCPCDSTSRGYRCWIGRRSVTERPPFDETHTSGLLTLSFGLNTTRSIFPSFQESLGAPLPFPNRNPSPSSTFCSCLRWNSRSCWIYSVLQRFQINGGKVSHLSLSFLLFLSLAMCVGRECAMSSWI